MNHKIASRLTLGISLLFFCATCNPLASRPSDASEVLIKNGVDVPSDDTDVALSTVAITSDVKYGNLPDAPITMGVSLCSGTLIAQNVVLTAAHCLYDTDRSMQPPAKAVFPAARNYLVFFGRKVSQGGQWIRAARIVAHPDWSLKETLRAPPTRPPNDIGLIFLESSAPAWKKPAKFEGASAEPLKNLLLAGYGVSVTRTDASTSGTLRSVELPMRQVDPWVERLTITAGAKGVCGGDSGGPAYRKNSDGSLTVVGITSAGAPESSGECNTRYTDFTDARAHFDWIRREMGLIPPVAALPPIVRAGKPRLSAETQFYYFGDSNYLTRVRARRALQYFSDDFSLTGKVAVPKKVASIEIALGGTSLASAKINPTTGEFSLIAKSVPVGKQSLQFRVIDKDGNSAVEFFNIEVF